MIDMLYADNVYVVATAKDGESREMVSYFGIAVPCNWKAEPRECNRKRVERRSQALCIYLLFWLEHRSGGYEIRTHGKEVS